MIRKSRFVSGYFVLAGVLLVAAVGCHSEAEKHYKMGKQLAGEDRIDEALEEYKLSAQADPEYAKPLYKIGQIYEHREKYRESAEWYQKAIDADPDYVRSYAELVKAWLRAGEFDKAEAAAKDALERRVVKRDLEEHKGLQDLLITISEERKKAPARPSPSLDPAPTTPGPGAAPTSPTALNP